MLNPDKHTDDVLDRVFVAGCEGPSQPGMGYKITGKRSDGCLLPTSAKPYVSVKGFR
jgi:hypothetical protein